MEGDTGEPTAKPEWMQSGDAETRFPYVADIERLAYSDRRLAGLRNCLRKSIVAEETSVPIEAQPYRSLSGCVLDFDSERLLAQKSIDQVDLKEGREKFLLATREIPSFSRTRIIVVEKDQNMKDVLWGGDDAAMLLQHEIVEALGSGYGLHPSYFGQITYNDSPPGAADQDIPNPFERNRLVPFDILGIPDDPLLEAVPYVSFALRFNHVRKYHHGNEAWAGKTFPKLWITITKDPGNLSRNFSGFNLFTECESCFRTFS
jgi:hypothetical protein